MAREAVDRLNVHRVSAEGATLKTFGLHGARPFFFPPFLPPFFVDFLFPFLPRAEPLLLPPPLSLFTVAHARLSASFLETPFFSYPSSMCSALRFCLSVYFPLSPLGIALPSLP